jgi:hypothetical protein
MTGAATTEVEPLTDAELTELALAADPDAPIDDDAVSFWELAGPGTAGPLPDWYMPAPMAARPLSGWRRRLVRYNVFLIIASFVAINAYGLCNTYGQLHL